MVGKIKIGTDSSGKKTNLSQKRSQSVTFAVDICVKVQNQNDTPPIIDVCPILMQPLVPGQSSAFIPSGDPNDDDISIKSSYFWKLVPKNKGK